MKKGKKSRKRISEGRKARKNSSARHRAGSRPRSRLRAHSHLHSSPSRAFIWFVRHAQAEGNERHIFNGSRIDAPLTSLGGAQAGYWAAHFPFKPDAILTSPLLRARQSAEPLSERFAMPALSFPLAMEQDYGQLSGKSRDRLLGPRYRKYFHVSPSGQMYTLRAPGGESWDDLKERARKCLRWLDSHYAGKKVVVVSHSDFMNCAYGVRHRLDNHHVWMREDVPNCGTVRL